MIVDDRDSCTIVAVVSPSALKAADEKGTHPSRPEDFQFLDIGDELEEWVVLHYGSDYVLLD